MQTKKLMAIGWANRPALFRRCRSFLFATVFLLSTNDVLGAISVGQFQVKAFFIVLPILCLLSFLAELRVKAIETGFVRIFLIPSSVLLLWDVVVSLASNAGPSLYSIVIPITFATAYVGYCLVRYSSNTRLRSLLYASRAISGFGILQYILSVLQLSKVGIGQWWVIGYLPRIAGLTYEPSYYALVLTLFIGTFLWLGHFGVFKRSEFIRFITFDMFLLGIALALSSSRLSIGVFVLLSMALCAHAIWDRRAVSLRLRSLKCFALGLILGIATTFFLLPIVSRLHPDAGVQSFMQGTGLGGTAAHSVEARLRRMESTAGVVRSHPIIGVGISNVPDSIWKLETQKKSPFVWQRFVPANPVLEILAAWGAIGAIVLTAVILWVMRLRGALARRANVLTQAGAAGWFLCLVLLNYNQNPFRSYIWLFLGWILAAQYFRLRKRQFTRF